MSMALRRGWQMKSTNFIAIFSGHVYRESRDTEARNNDNSELAHSRGCHLASAGSGQPGARQKRPQVHVVKSMQWADSTSVTLLSNVMAPSATPANHWHDRATFPQKQKRRRTQGLRATMISLIGMNSSSCCLSCCPCGISSSACQAAVQ